MNCLNQHEKTSDLIDVFTELHREINDSNIESKTRDMNVNLCSIGS
jgi:hypothetical protein